MRKPVIETKLYTRSGDYVTTVLVPPFKPLAEVIGWGDRLFVYDRTAHQYREGLMFIVPYYGPPAGVSE
jgi:hypothetical protein